MWSASAKANKTAAYNSRLCASQQEDAWHVGAGLSMTAAALLAAAKHLRTEQMNMLIWRFQNRADPFGGPFKGILFYFGCKRGYPYV